MTPARSLILETAVRTVFQTVLLFSLFLMFAGHNAPGGGFIGGLVAGAGFVLRHLSGGTREGRTTARVPAEVLLGGGVLLAAGTGIASLVAGGSFLESAKVEATLPLLGAVKTTSALAFDLGVYLVVVGVVLALLDTLGGEPDRGEQQ